MKGITITSAHKKRISILIAASIVLMLAGCGQNRTDMAIGMEEGQSDLNYVQSKGTLIVGITDFAPMDYLEGEQWKGFDAELAQAFAKSLGVTAELKQIDWDKKTELLENGTIDCIWNGMTMTEQLQRDISCSDPYLSNAQVIVLRNSEAEQYNTEDACQHVLFAVEAGSTGESLLKEKKYRYTAYPTQLEALQSVRKKEADATVIDIIMAAFYTGDGKEFDDLTFHISLNDEKICVGFRKNSDLTAEANTFLHASYEDGTISTLADTYGISNALLKDE